MLMSFIKGATIGLICSNINGHIIVNDTLNWSWVGVFVLFIIYDTCNDVMYKRK